VLNGPLEPASAFWIAGCISLAIASLALGALLKRVWQASRCPQALASGETPIK
jgi:hypothetical protein